MGYALLALVNGEGQDRLTDQIKALRRQLAAELGFVMPSVRILDNVQLDANSYVVRVKEIEAGSGRIFPGQFMAMDPMGGQVQLPGQHMLEPTFGLPATWIDAALRDQAQLKGYTVVDAATVVSTHLTEVIKAHVSELLNHVEVSKLLRELSKEHAELLKEIVPSQISTTGIQRVLQFLLAERVSIRDLGAIVEAIAEVAGGVKNPRDVVEHVRARLGRQICAQYQDQGGTLPIITLSPAWEQAFMESIVGRARGALPRDAALEAQRIRHRGPRSVRGRGPPGRDAGPRHLGADAALRALDHRALPPRDAGDEPGRDPPAGAAADGELDLSAAVSGAERAEFVARPGPATRPPPLQGECGPSVSRGRERKNRFRRGRTLSAVARSVALPLSRPPSGATLPRRGGGRRV